MLSIVPTPASFKLQEGSYTVDRNGYIVFDFVRVTDEGFDYSSKKTFVMTAKNVDTILGIDAFNRKPNKKDEGEIAFYSQKDDSATRVLKIARPSEDYFVSYFDINENEDQSDKQGEHTVPLKVG